MSRFYILPILALAFSAGCVSSTRPSKIPAGSIVMQEQKSDICPESMMKDVDGDGYQCVDIFSMRLEEQLNKKYEYLLHRIASKDSKLNGVSKEYFLGMRRHWENYTDRLCSDPSITAEVRPLADSYIRICRFEQSLHHLQALERFENAL